MQKIKLQSIDPSDGCAIICLNNDFYLIRSPFKESDKDYWPISKVDLDESIFYGFIPLDNCIFDNWDDLKFCLEKVCLPESSETLRDEFEKFIKELPQIRLYRFLEKIENEFIKTKKLNETIELINLILQNQNLKNSQLIDKFESLKRKAIDFQTLI